MANEVQRTKAEERRRRIARRGPLLALVKKYSCERIICHQPSTDVLVSFSFITKVHTSLLT